MPTLIKVPYLGTAEGDVLLTDWFVSEGSEVRKGEALASVETLKASFEVEAEADGVFARRLVDEGARVPTGQVLGVLLDGGEALESVELQALLDAAQLALDAESGAAATDAESINAGAGTGTEGAPTSSASSGTARATDSAGARFGPEASAGVAPVARRRAAELGVELASVVGTGKDGWVRLEDVEAAARAPVAATADGRIDPAFVAHLRREGEAFAALSSDFKLALYRRHGALIGRGCVLGPGALLIAETLVLGDGCVFARDARVEVVELRAGAMCHLGPRGRVRCRQLVLGDNAFFAEDVEIGGGGAMDPEARLVVGSHGFVGEHVHLNPCRELVIGDEVVVSRGAVIMTHSFGGSVLAGYPNRFAGVRIGDGCQIGIQASLFPGAEMGAGSILLSGSTLVSGVPAGRLFGGVPAKGLKAAARPLAPAELERVACEQVHEFARQMQLRGREVSLEELDGETRVTILNGAARHVLRFAAELPEAPLDGLAEELRVGLRCAEERWEAQPSEVVAIDFSVPRVRGPAGPLGDAFREFLRKRGVRLRPRTWTYPGGWL